MASNNLQYLAASNCLLLSYLESSLITSTLLRQQLNNALHILQKSVLLCCKQPVCTYTAVLPVCVYKIDQIMPTRLICRRASYALYLQCKPTDSPRTLWWQRVKHFTFHHDACQYHFRVVHAYSETLCSTRFQLLHVHPEACWSCLFVFSRSAAMLASSQIPVSLQLPSRQPSLSSITIQPFSLSVGELAPAFLVLKLSPVVDCETSTLILSYTLLFKLVNCVVCHFKILFYT